MEEKINELINENKNLTQQFRKFKNTLEQENEQYRVNLENNQQALITSLDESKEQLENRLDAIDKKVEKLEAIEHEIQDNIQDLKITGIEPRKDY